MAQKKVLATDVYVTNEAGQGTLLAAGTEVPKWASKLVTNPKAFVDVEGEATDDGSGDGSGQTPPATTPPVNTHVAKRAGVDDVPPYDTWAYHDLQQEAIGRQLDGGGAGKGEEIVARLAADDAAQAPQQ
jgi:hypothetical protein